MFNIKSKINVNHYLTVMHFSFYCIAITELSQK